MQSVVLAGLVALALSARAHLHLGAAYPAKAAVGVVAMMVITAVRVRAHHPFATFGAANLVTTVRASLVALVASFIGEPGSPVVAGTVVAMSLAVTLLDGVDGLMARRTGMASAFGARFDMEVDAVLILALTVLAWQYGKAGPWVVLSGLLRYLFIAAGWIWPWMGRPLQPTLRGKAICVVQIVVLVLIVIPAVEPPASTAIAACGLAALVYSFFVDTVWLWMHAGAPEAPPRA